MLRIVGFTLALLALPGAERALAEDEQPSELRAIDDTGCYTTDGSFASPTIGIAAGLYHEAWFPKERALKMIKVALESGCDIEEPDDVGSTPLVASIVYNEPELAKFLLQHGANPYLAISSSKPYLDGQNAFQILEFLTSRQPSQDRNELIALFAAYQEKR